MSNDIRIFYRGEHFWRYVPEPRPNYHRDIGLYGWFVDMPDGSFYDDGTGEGVRGYREFGPFQTLREAYDYAVPPESEGPQ